MGEKPDNMKKTIKRISSEQKAALEAAGYKVNRSGTSVQDKNGGTVGGFNENGQISSGSPKVTSILKSKPAPAKAPAPTAKPATKRAAPVAKKDATAGLIKRASAAIDRATTAKKQPARSITPTPTKMPARPISKTPPRLSTVTEAQWDSMSRADRAKKGLPTSWVDYVKAGGDSVVKPAKPVVAKAPNRMDAYKMRQRKK